MSDSGQVTERIDAPQAAGAAERPRRRAPAAERRSQIVAAALQCFADKGYHAATMDDVVRASGLSKGSLYWHFQSKEDLLLALFDVFVDEVFAAWDAEAEGAAGVLDVLRRRGAHAVATLCSEAQLLRAWAEFLSHPAARARLAAVYTETRGRLASWIRRGVARGELRELSPESAAVALLASIEGLVIQALVDPQLDAVAHWRTSFDVLRRGMAR